MDRVVLIPKFRVDMLFGLEKKILGPSSRNYIYSKLACNQRIPIIRFEINIQTGFQWIK